MPGPGYYLRQGSLSIPSSTTCNQRKPRVFPAEQHVETTCRGHFPFQDKERWGRKKSQTCSKTFILPDYMTQIGRAVDDNNNNEDVIKVKYLMLTRLKAECSNLIIMAGCSALNQQLLWENAPILMRKHQKKAKAKGRKSVSGRRTGIQSKHCMCQDKRFAFSYHCYV